MLDVTYAQLEKPPKLGNDADIDIFLGLAKIKDRVKITFLVIMQDDRVTKNSDYSRIPP